MAKGKTTRKPEQVVAESDGTDALIPSKKLMAALKRRKKNKGLRAVAKAP